MSSYKPNVTLLAGFFPKFACLSMYFILEMACTAGSASDPKNKLHAQIIPLQCKWCNNDKLSLYDGAMYSNTIQFSSVQNVITSYVPEHGI